SRIVARRGDVIANRLAIETPALLDRKLENLQRVIAEGGVRFGILSVAIADLLHEVLHERTRIADEVVIQKIRAADGFAADLDHRRRVPAVGADERNCET